MFKSLKFVEPGWYEAVLIESPQIKVFYNSDTQILRIFKEGEFVDEKHLEGYTAEQIDTYIYGLKEGLNGE